MDKKQLIGLVLIFGLFYAWSLMNSQSRKKLAEEQRIEDSIAQVQNPVKEDTLEITEENTPIQEETIIPEFVAGDSLNAAKLAYQYGPFAPSSQGEVKEYILENEKIKIFFSNKGGIIDKVQLKDFKKVQKISKKEEEKVDLLLLEDEKNQFRYEIPIAGVPGNLIRTDELYFDVVQKDNNIRFIAHAENGASFEQIYTLDPDKYDLDYQIKLNDLSRHYPSGTSTMNLSWINYLDRIERNYTFEKFYSTVYYKEQDNDSDYCNCRKSDEDKVDDKKLEWVSHVNQFFNSTLLTTGAPFEGAVVSTEMMEEDGVDLKKITSDIQIPLESSSSYAFDMQMYLGPNDFDLLRSYDRGLEQVIPFGRSLFGAINRWVVRPLFNFLNGLVGNKGMAIILMIFIVKMLLYPLTYKMLYSQAKMGALKPEITKTKDKFKDDPQKQQVENMKLYREYGVSPLGGCMPMIIQMPIWYALFRFFPASIDFRQEPFLWASDLSSYDVIAYLPFEIPAFGSHISLFTILWAISTVAYTFYSTRHVDMSAQPAMKYVQYFMPLMFLVFFNNYASGLTCYMFFSTLINVVQTVGTKKFVFNEDRIRAELMKNKSTPKKKGRFAQRLEDAMKQQQAMQNQKKGK